MGLLYKVDTSFNLSSEQATFPTTVDDFIGVVAVEFQSLKRASDLSDMCFFQKITFEAYTFQSLKRASDLSDRRAHIIAWKARRC